MKFIKDLGMLDTGGKTKRRFYLVQCDCLLMFKTRADKYKTTPPKLCKYCANKRGAPTHSGSKTRVYRTWRNILSRCYVKDTKYFKDYGGRGITVCKEWRDDFVVFRDWAHSNGYEDTLTIDRKDNDKGYSPSNCRWVTRTVQAQNTRRLKVTNTSGYRGVSKTSDGKAWQVRVQVNQTSIFLGRYETPKEASNVYDDYITKHKLEHTTNKGVSC